MRRRSIPLLLLALALGWLWTQWGGERRGTAGSLTPSQGARAGELEKHALPLSEGTASRIQDNDGEPLKGSRKRARTLDGRCVEHRGAEPVGGVWVEFLRAGQRVAQAQSDAAGEFSVALPVDGFETVRVEAPAGWWCVGHGKKGSWYVVRLAPSDTGPLRALLLDSNTREPVPEYLLRLEDREGWSETLYSDGQGRILSSVFFVRGEVSMTPMESNWARSFGGRVLARFEHSPEGADPAPVTIEVNVGPTYRFQLTNPGDVALNKLRAHVLPASWVENVEYYFKRGAEVHGGDPLWARIDGPHVAGEDQQFVIVDTGHHWLGSVPVTHSQGIGAEVLQVQLEPLLRVRGRVLDRKGQPVARAIVELMATQGDAHDSSRRTRSNGRGLFIIEGARRPL